MIGLLSNRGFEQLMVDAYAKMVNYSAKQGIDLHFEMATEGYTIAENRNSLAAKACQKECTHLLMIDDDMIFPENTLELLLKQDRDVIGVLYNPRQFSDGFMVNAIMDKHKKIKIENLPKEPFECYGVGFGTVLIKTELFYKIERPWFDWIIYDTGMVKDGEDFYFCKKAKEFGFSIWCEPTLKTGHIGSYVY